MRICALGCTKVMHIQYTAWIRTLLFVDCQQVFGLVFQTRAGDQYGNPFVKLPSILSWAALLSFHHIGERKAG